MAASEQIVSSEGVYDFNCTPCTKRERFIEAQKFCVECGEYFCSTCLSFHEHFGATKGHTLIDCNDVSTGHVVTRLAKCKIHEGKEEDMVCGEHDVVCCRVCIATSHSSCHGINYLPQAAQSFREGDKCSELGKDIKCKTEDLQTSYRELITRAVQLKMRKKTLLNRLKLFKVSTTKLIEDLVTGTETDIENTYEPAISDTQKHIQIAEKLLSKLDILPEELANENDPILVYKKSLECKRTLREVTQFKPSVLSREMAVNNKALTRISETVKKSLDNNRYFGVIDIAGLDANSDIPNICVRSDGSFCLAHFHGSKIIHMDNSLKVIDIFDTKSNVWGICTINECEIAFTIPALKKVQILDYNRSPVIKKSFFSKMKCRGITYCNANIYVAGGGSQEAESAQINIFDLKGNLLNKLELDSDGFSVLRSVAADTENIYVTDCETGVICMDLYGKQKWTYKSSKCKYPWGICLTPNSNLLIAGMESNNIAVLNKDGELLGELLTEDDGISAPKAVSIDTPNNRLLVMAKGSIMKMFEFEGFGI